jgi:acyl-CoA synthetase (AMP-forming)/AMP-acid ligase II
MNIAEVLAARAAENPQSIAIIDAHRGRPRFTSFAELDRAGARGAALLEKSGLRPGDAVLIFQPMSVELYVALISVFRLGLVAMFLDPSAGRDHIARCCDLQAPRALIAGTKAHLLRLVSPALRRIPVKLVLGWPVPGAVSWSRSAALPPRPDVVSCTADAPALLTFTSGSMGLPKAAVRSHGFLLAQHRALAESLHLTPGGVDLATMPIVLLANLASGVTSLIPDADLRSPGAIDPEPVLAQAQAHRATSSVASPAFFERLARCCIQRRQTLPSLSKLFTGGAPVFPRLLGQMQEMAPAAEVVAVYGSTEAEPIAHVARRELSEADHQAMLAGKGLLAGVPVPSIRLRILRDSWGRPVGPFAAEEFAKHCLPPEVAGEIVVSGEHVLPGYLHGQGDEETKLRVDGTVWHRTGDAGYLDGAGRVWLLGRCAARIEDARGTLYPFAAETAVYQDPAVRRAAVVARQGRRILAVEYYEHKSHPDLAPLRQALGWAHLDEVRALRDIPVDRRHNAKIDYPALHRLLERVG